MSLPARADHIGSLLRPKRLREAFRARAENKVGDAALAAAQDEAIREVIRLQEDCGMKVVTDGEFRRTSYHSYFYGQLGDISFEAPPDAGSGRGVQPVASIRSRIAWKTPIHAGDFAFLSARTKALPKITIPGPCALHFRGGDATITKHAYRDVDQFWDDVVAAFQNELRALAAVGCTYAQIDETAFAKFGDADVQATLRARGDESDALIDKYIDITNRVLADIPGIRIGMHLCRGNRAGQWHAEGSYESVAEKLFNQLAIKFFFLEYDSERAGDFAPLRFVPQDKSIVLGLVSTKTNFLEDKSMLKRRLDEAARYVPLDRLAVSPQCGFASTDAGNPISPEMQEAKLRLVVELARETWGSA